MNMSKYTIQDANLLLNLEEFAERSAGMTVALMVDFFSGYNQVPLHPKSCDMTVFQTPLGLLWQMILPQGATNSPS